ncbi:hypothetical protein F0L68_37995 [Solihabitans fulvus]|uniref:ABC3 transporter permease C-terminal domain-containing protein n=1 Tax=Solihabitans fulvus TaxID=1892852 RepID=A0A5B2WL68_9PSEU|nr:FtsX-like permease family protein [Solihabitans fulvus]KAA2251219.1 hypothetical protein F0L68_37995 [Solihabitans fulvus]
MSPINLPWQRSPRAALSNPVTIVVAVVIGLVVAFVASATALYVSATGSAAVQYENSQLCEGDTGLRIREATNQPPVQGEREQRIKAAAAADGADVIRHVRAGGAALLIGGGHTNVLLVAKDHGLDNVVPVEGSGVDGVWVPTDLAAVLGLHAGGTLTIATRSGSTTGPTTLPIAGVYRRVVEPAPPFWCSDEGYLVPHPEIGEAGAPPPLLVAPALFDTLRDKGLAPQPGRIQFATATLPVTVTEQRRWSAQVDAMRRDVGQVLAQDAPAMTNQAAVTLAAGESAQSTVLSSLLPLTGASLLAGLLAVFGLAGQWSQRRAAEIRLLWTRGARPVSLGGKAGLELGLPLLLGSALGWAAARLTVPLLAPAGQLDPWAGWVSAALAAGTWLLVLLVLVASAALRVRRQHESGRAGRLTPLLGKVLRRTPWELLAGGLAVLSWRRLSGGSLTVRPDSLLPTVDVFALAFPVLCIAVLLGLAARLAGWALRASHRRRGWRRPAALWALRRSAAQSRVTLALLAVAGLAIGVIVVGIGVADTQQNSIQDKGLVFAGANTVVRVANNVGDRPELPAPIRGRATRVLWDEPKLDDGRQGRILVVDPATYADGGGWQDRWNGLSLAELLGKLGPADRDGTVPVIQVGSYQPARFVAPELAKVRVVATVPVFAGMMRAEGMLVAAWDAVPANVRGEYNQQVWTMSDSASVLKALQDNGMRPGRILRAENTTGHLPFLLIGWVFRFFVVLGSALIAVAAVTLLVSVETRRRSTAVAHALLARMGLRTRALYASHAAELTMLAALALLVGLGGGWLAVRLAGPELDPYPNLHPGTIPASVLPVAFGAVGGAAVAVLLVAAHAVLAARRAPVKELLRG